MLVPMLRVFRRYRGWLAVLACALVVGSLVFSELPAWGEKSVHRFATSFVTLELVGPLVDRMGCILIRRRRVGSRILRTRAS
jgi:hypothetical protein